jgi:rhamnosyl/mannosyltransferase
MRRIVVAAGMSDAVTVKFFSLGKVPVVNRDAAKSFVRSDEKPRVLYASKLYHPWTGGIESIVRWHAEGLAPSFNTSVLACSPRGRSRTDFLNGVRVRRAASLGIFKGMPVSPTYLLEFRKAVRKADLVHLHLPFPPADIADVLFGNRNVPVVATWHSDLVRQRTVMPVYRPFMRRFLGRADRIIVPARTVLENSPDLAPFRHKCTVVPLGVPLPREGSATLDPPQRDEGLPIVLFVGRLAYYKGLDHLIDAMAMINARLVIAGEGEMGNVLRDRVRRHGLEGRVQFAGRISDEELDYLYRRCAVLVLPSTGLAETSGIVQLEAMARRKPVVNTSLKTDVPEISIDGLTGITVAPGSAEALAAAVNRLLADEGLRSWLGENGWLRVRQHFTVERMNDTVAAIYNKLLGLTQPVTTGKRHIETELRAA